MDLVIVYHDAVERLILLAGVPRAVLCMHIGMGIYLGCLLLLGTRRGSLAAVLGTVLLAVVHECMNRLFHGSWRWHDTTQELVLTLFWPTMCYAVSHFRRWCWTERARERDNARLLHLYDYRPEEGAKRHTFELAPAGGDESG